MTSQLITLDWQSGIQIDPAGPPFKNFQVLDQMLAGLKLLADHVRDLELNVIAQDPNAKGTFRAFSNDFPPALEPCSIGIRFR